MKKVIGFNLMSHKCLIVTVTGRFCVGWCDREDINLWQIPSTCRSRGSYPNAVSFGALRQLVQQELDLNFKSSGMIGMRQFGVL